MGHLNGLNGPHQGYVGGWLYGTTALTRALTCFLNKLREFCTLHLKTTNPSSDLMDYSIRDCLRQHVNLVPVFFHLKYFSVQMLFGKDSATVELKIFFNLHLTRKSNTTFCFSMN